MKTRFTAIAIWLTVLVPALAVAQTVTFSKVLELAKANAPQLKATQANIAVAQAQVEAADDWRTNPTLAVSSGPRFGDDTSLDVMVGLEMPLVFGATLDSQTAVASAAEQVARAELLHEEEVVVIAAAQAFANTLYWQYRVGIATDNLALVTEIEAVTAARQAAGDAGALESSIALLARHRAQADIARLQAAELDAAGQLKWLIGLEADAALVVDGDLNALANQTSARTQERGDIAVSKAKTGEAKAEQELARNATIPDLNLGAEGGIEEHSTLIRATLAVTLPIFWRGAGDVLVGEAREEAQRQETQALERRVQHETKVSEQKMQLLNSALQTFGDQGIPEARKAAEIANASYKAGAMPLPDLLVIRRELASAEEEFAELLLLAALARIDALASTGAINTMFQNETKRREK